MGIKGMAGETGKGPYRHQWAIWKGAIAVGYGDAIYQDTGDVNGSSFPYNKPANLFTWSVDLATTQVNFKQVFCGYSEVRRTAAQTADGDQTTDGCILGGGEFTKPCAALGSAAVVGAWVGPAQGAGNTLSATNVMIVTNVSRAIGKLTRPAAVNSTELTFECMPGTLDGVAAIS